MGATVWVWGDRGEGGGDDGGDGCGLGEWRLGREVRCNNIATQGEGTGGVVRVRWQLRMAVGACARACVGM